MPILTTRPTLPLSILSGVRQDGCAGVRTACTVHRPSNRGSGVRAVELPSERPRALRASSRSFLLSAIDTPSIRPVPVQPIPPPALSSPAPHHRPSLLLLLRSSSTWLLLIAPLAPPGCPPPGIPTTLTCPPATSPRPGPSTPSTPAAAPAAQNPPASHRQS
ncbi:hypothetical protein P154DRAFT_312016 [Amniculicola lignicola CBS 123094]|uniref:Uncharacterized protein n=1 Tax=Amniculicola lignicola CBS 123094 TaxID=1392246 RepID=A0A6A5WFY4_9PLEO|nr:hypothetical protein P154DRAFT_312016 [Amniculicola lignicola CBS 123094]